MPKTSQSRTAATKPLAKAATGIQGLDEITSGGLPRGRPTLVCGGAGCGKTLFATEFLVRGAIEFGEPGVFMTFEETVAELTQNVRSLGFNLDDLVKQKKLAMDFVRVERHEIEETGEYDLEGLFVRLGHAVDSIGAKRVVMDTVETLFSGLSNQGILRAELRRLFRWLKEKGVTAVITGERGEGTLTRYGLEEYVSDCVIVLDHRIIDEVATRRIRILKYRGSVHGTNEYPFLIDEKGFSVLPITSLGLQHTAGTERITSGIPRLDAMLGGRGYYRGSTILISGTAGVGKTSVAAHFVDAACKRGERCLYLSFEESPSQVIRNMRSIGLELEPWFKKGLLIFRSERATSHGLELHLATIHKDIDQFQPQVIVFDPISSVGHAGTQRDASTMLTRLIDFLKMRNITALLTNLTSDQERFLEKTDLEVSSLVDTWLLLRDVEREGERNRVLYILKSRGMPHSNQLREFVLTEHGIQLLDVYLGPEGVLTGSARQSQEAREKALAAIRQQEIESKQRDLERRRKAMEGEIASLRNEFEMEEAEALRLIGQLKNQEEIVQYDRERMSISRKADQDEQASGLRRRRLDRRT
jgi:circadian clock protein KaiC